MDRGSFFEHPGKVAKTDKRFEHVMAITLDPRTNYQEGVIRCVVSREGDVAVSGFRDRSELHRVSGNSLERFQIGERITMKNENKFIDELAGEGGDFIGFEDPDIWIDDGTGTVHLYFTIPIRRAAGDYYSISLGHAVGKDLDSLEMTAPALAAGGKTDSAKEVSIAPKNKKGFRFNLIESYSKIGDTGYSTVRVAIAHDMGKPWEYGETVFHPAEHRIPWIAGHASPGPLASKNFIDVGEGKLLGFINGREAIYMEDKMNTVMHLDDKVDIFPPVGGG